MYKAFIKSSCKHCRSILMPVEQINLNLPFNKKIELIDSYAWEMWQMKNHPVMDKVNFSGYPTLFLSGIKINNILSKDQIKSFLDGFYEGDKIVPEMPKWEKFKKKKGL